MGINDPFDFGGEIVWRPSCEIIAQSNLSKIIKKYEFNSYNDFFNRSISDIRWFWEMVLRELDIRFSTPYTDIVDMSRGIALPRWCVNGKMNIVENCLSKYAGTETDKKSSLRWEKESGETGTLTYSELRIQVGKMANALHDLGLKKGDVIGVYLPMIPQTVIAMLAIIKIGGIFLPLFSGFGSQAIISRLNDAEGKALFTIDKTYRRGAAIDMEKIAQEAAKQIPTLTHLIVVEEDDSESKSEIEEKDSKSPFSRHAWKNLMKSQVEKSIAEKTDAEDPLMILYTSGTTGKPKGTVHTHCGFPIKAAQDIWLGMDLHPEETFFWISDIGWMMGPWLIFGTLLNGATIMLYDGALDYPEPDRLWKLVDQHQVTALGVSPTLIRAFAHHGEELVKKYSLKSLRKFGSTGEPWDVESWLWLFNKVGKGKLPVINYSGGTETSGGILMGNVLTPQKPCSFAGPVAGMAADVIDGKGNSIRGKVGELVIRQPWIGMTRGFWHDEERYLEIYWSQFPNMWLHGDWAAVDEDDQWYILGRSDDTIKVAGKRLGPAEVESILMSHPSVFEATAIGIPDKNKGQSLVCFCVIKSDYTKTEKLQNELKDQIIQAMGKPLAPKKIHFISELPKTRNGKLLRRLVRAAYLKENLGDTSSLENPKALEQIRNAA